MSYGQATQPRRDTPPRINLPDEIIAVVDDPIQLFWRGIVEDVDPYRHNIAVRGVDGQQATRYYDYTPSGAQEHTMFVDVRSGVDNSLLVSDSTTLKVLNKVTSPGVKKILCVGDSLTIPGIWPAEFIRRITGSGGSPLGDGLSGPELIGTQDTAGTLHEGHSGQDWEFFANATGSPFSNGVSLDFANYVTTNSFGSIDFVFFLVGWNSNAGGRKTAADHAVQIGHARTVIDALLADFPACQVVLLGLNGPSVFGGLGESYGDDDSPYGNYFQLLQTVNGMNLAFQDLANEYGGGNVHFADTSTQFDLENSLPEATNSVNSRSAKVETVQTNGIHPNTDGYHQIADVAYRTFHGYVVPAPIPPLPAGAVWQVNDVQGSPSLWEDQIGSNDAVQATPGLQPSLSNIGGRQALLFDNVDDIMDMSPISLTGEFSIAMAVQRTSDGVSDYPCGGTNTWIRFKSSAGIRVWFAGGATIDFDLPYTVPGGASAIFIITRGAADSTRAFLDDIESASGAQAVTGTPDFRQVGGSASLLFGGEIGELLFWDRELSRSEARDAYTALNAKW